MQHLDLTWLHDISASLETHDFVAGLLGNGTASVIYGEPNCGKTFFALELALSVARGTEFFGRDVIPSGVIYVALEGGYGIRNRIAAYLQHHGIDKEAAARIPFAVVTTNVNLLEPDSDTPSVIAAIQAAADRIGEPIRLVIIDTLSRAMAGGNENSPEDMTGLIGGVDRIRMVTHCHVALVHHCGKETARGMRGHSSLRGAIDTEIEVSKQANGSGTISIAKVLKQRDLEIDGEFQFKLQPVTLGINDRGREVTSCVVEPYTPEDPVSTAIQASKQKPLARGQATVFRALQELIARDGKEAPPSDHIPHGKLVADVMTWQKYYYAIAPDTTQNAKYRAFVRNREILQDLKRIGCWQDYAWII